MSYNAVNYHAQGATEWVVGGTLTFEGSGQINDTGKYEDFRVPMNAVRVGAAKIHGFSTMFGGFMSYAFDPASEEQVYLIVQLPHGWKMGSELHPHVHWCTTAATTEKVVWGLEYSMAELGSTFPDGTTVYAADESSGAFLHTLTDIADITTTEITTVSPIMMVRLFRFATDSSDTYAADAHLLEFDIHYQVQRLGTTAEYE